MGIILYLLSPRLDSDATGRGITTLMLLLIFVCFLRAVLEMSFTRSPWRRISAVLGVAVLTGWFGWEVWPRTITVSPADVVFSLANETYSFRVTNRSYEDVYRVNLTYTLAGRSPSVYDFAIDTPTRKAMDGSKDIEQHVADTLGFMCPSGKPFIWLAILRLTPHETREIKITSLKAGSGTRLSARPGSFSSKPEPIVRDGASNKIAARVMADNSCADLRSFGFRGEEKGMHWFTPEESRLYTDLPFKQ